MKTILPRSKTFHFWNTVPSIDDIINIINHIPNAALLYDLEKNQIINGNINLLRLTAYTRYELLELSLKELILFSNEKEEIFSQFNTQQPLTAELITRHSQKIPTLVTASPLDENRRWYLLTIETQDSKNNQVTADQQVVFLCKTFEEFANKSISTQKEATLKFFLQKYLELVQNGFIAVYEVQYEEQTPIRLIKSESSINDNVLPPSIAVRDINPYREIILWQKGKQSTPEILLLSRKHQINLLLSLPIKAGETLFGVLIIATNKLKIDECILPALTSLTEILSLHYMMWQSLQTVSCESEEHKKQSLLHNKIIENVQDGVILLSNDNTILSINPAAEHILGYLTHETYGQPVENILIGTANLSTALQLANEGVETPNLGDITLHRRDGKAFNAFLQVIPVNEDKQSLGKIIIIRDLSQYHEIKIRTQQLEQRALLGELTAIFSHEIGNPLNNISLALQTLNEQIDHNQPYYIHIQRIQSDLDRLANLMKTVLSFSKSSTYNMIEMDIVELIEKVLMRWQTHLAKQQIQTHFQTELTSAYILGHAQALEQVFTNLFSNALRAMEGMDDGTLHIKVDRIWLDKQQDYIQITVSDNGIGIPKEHLDHIFQPFFTTDHQNGTGLGLTITERIVIAHKGKIQVKSFPSGGSVFILTFPAVHPNKT